MIASSRLMRASMANSVVPGSTASWAFERLPIALSALPPPSSPNSSTACAGRTVSASPATIRVGAWIAATSCAQSKSSVSKRPHLGDKPRPVFGLGRYTDIGFAYLGQEGCIRIKRRLERVDLGIHSIILGGSRGDHQLAHYLRVPDGSLQCDAPAHRKAEDVGTFVSQVRNQGSYVVRHLLVGERPIDVSRVPMALQLDGDDLPGLGQVWQNLFHHADRHEAAGKQNERFPRPMDLIIHLETVYLCIAALAVRVLFIRARCHDYFSLTMVRFIFRRTSIHQLKG